MILALSLGWPGLVAVGLTLSLVAGCVAGQFIWAGAGEADAAPGPKRSRSAWFDEP